MTYTKVFFLAILMMPFQVLLAINSPSNVSPSDGATDQAVSLTLDWSAVSGNSGYIYQIDTVSSFDSPALVEGDSPMNTSGTIVSDLRFGTTYHWRVRAYDDVDTSVWSVPTEFATTDQLTNVSPSDGATDQAVSMALDWSAIYGNSGYIFQIDTVSSFDSAELVEGDSPVNTSETTISDLRFGTVYYWRARVYNDVDTSAWSVPTEFTTTDQLTNVSPSDGAVNQDVGLDIDWSYISGLSGYLYELDTVPDFSSPVLFSGSAGSSPSEASVSDLYFGTTYYWRVRAYNGVDTSAWSVPTEFTTANQLTNVSPSDGAVNQDVGLDIDWSYISGLSGYLYELDTVPDFSSPVLFSGSAGSSP
ncbi:MAG TPA: fibronectin type III domain-containing protein, partial [Bacteroidales bacterium]|nr:fibronectin type III domain-containing protein [Bacteroidales bacterium]